MSVNCDVTRGGVACAAITNLFARGGVPAGADLSKFCGSGKGDRAVLPLSVEGNRAVISGGEIFNRLSIGILSAAAVFRRVPALKD